MENRQETRFPGEVVEVYRQPDFREVVETYSAPLPKRRAEKTPPAPVRRKRGKKGLWIFLGCVLVLAVLAGAALLLGGGLRAEPSFSFEWYYGEEWEEPREEITIPAFPVGQGAELRLSPDHGETLTIQEVYRTVNPSVVSLMVQVGDKVSLGTGVIFTEDGYILTNQHVVSGGEACVVLLESGEAFDAMYVAGDAANDLAVLKIEAEGLPAAEFGNSEALVVGDPAYAIGNPLGVELRGTLTDGIISAINRDVTVDGNTLTLLQTNAALNAGNSGGPLINQYGQVVGINVIKMRSSYSNVEGLGFAIPTAFVERMVNDLLTYGQLQPEPKLGLYVMNTFTQLTDDLRGAEVDSVDPGSAADKAGVQAGDYIIAVGDTAVEDSGDVLMERRKYYVGDEMPMTLWRDGAIIEVVLELEHAVE